MAGRGPEINLGRLTIQTEDLEQKVKNIRELLSGEGMKTKLGEKLYDSLNKSLTNVEKKVESVFQKMPGAGAKSKDVLNFAAQLASIGQDLDKIGEKAGNFEITDSYIQKNIESVKKLAEEFEEVSKKVTDVQTKIDNKKLNLIDDTKMKGRMRDAESNLKEVASSGNTSKLKGVYDEGKSQLDAQLKLFKEKGWDTTPIEEQKKAWKNFYLSLIPATKQMGEALENSKKKTEELSQAQKDARTDIENGQKNITGAINEGSSAFKKSSNYAHQYGDSLESVENKSKALDQVSNRIKQMFSVSSVFMIIRRIIRNIIQDFQELDKQFNEIAIVSKYSTKEMWDSFASVNAMAQEYGVTTKNILEVQNLYYHQGKEMAEVNKLTAQTLTLAKITGMDYAEATNKMTAALNAYKLEAEDAVRVTDTVAALSANAATSSEELMTALTKTASIAANAGVSLENTEVFLTKMIETTREAPENLGTALKTIVARFGEVKQEIDGEMIETADINKVDKALKSVGMTLLDSAGQVRDLDDVFMELSSKWDDLDRNTQRYIATQAAGSRQQSRFIAMMENYDRTLELTKVAQNAAGTGARQLAKAQESIETALNRLKSAWQEFYSSILKSGIIKWIIDLGNNILGLLNKINKIQIIGTPLSLAISGFTIWATKTLLVDHALKKLSATILAHTGIKKADNAEDIKKSSLLSKLSVKQAIFNRLQDQHAKTQLIREALQKMEVDGYKELNSETQEYIAAKTLEILATKGDTAAQEEAMTALLIKKGVDEAEAKALAKNIIATGAHTNAEIKDAAATNVNTKSQLGFIKTLKGKLTSSLTQAGTKFSEFAASIGMSTAALGATVAIIAVVAAAVVAATVIMYKKWEKQNKILTDTSEQLDKLSEKQQDYTEQVQKTKDLQTNVDILTKYKDTLILTTEQQEEYNQAINQIAEDYPSLIDYIDEEGNYHLKNIEILKDEIEHQRILNKEKREAYVKYKGQLAGSGIFEEDSRISQNFKQGIESAAIQLDPEETDSKKQAKLLRKRLEISRWSDYGNEDVSWAGGVPHVSWWEDLFEAVLNGSYQGGITKNQLNDILRSSEIKYSPTTKIPQLTDEQYQLFLKNISGKDLSQQNILQAITSTGIEGDTDLTHFAANLEGVNKTLNGAFDVIAQQWKEQSSLRKQSLYLNFDDIDFKFDTSEDINAKMAESIAEFMPDVTDTSFQTYLQKLTEKKYKDLSIIMNTDEIQLSDIGIQSLEDFNNIEENIASYLKEHNITEESDDFYGVYYNMLKEAFTLSPEEKNSITSVIGTEISDLGTLTRTQIDAMLKTAGTLTDIYGDQDNAALAYQKMNKILDEGTQKTNKYSQAVNSLNKNNLTTTQGIRQFGKDMKNSGLTTQQAFNIVEAYNNGINNLNLEDPDELLKDLTQSAENFNNQLEAMGRLKEGKGTLEDLSAMIQILTQGLEGTELLSTISNIDNAITTTANGLLVDMSIIGQAGEALLNEQITGNDFLMQVYQGVEQGALEAAKTAALGVQGLDTTTRAAIQTALSIDALLKLVDGLPGIKEQLKNNEEWSKAINRSAQARLNQTLLKYNSGMNKAASTASKAGGSAKDAADNAKKAWEEFAKWLREFDKYANLDKIISTLEEKLGHLEYEIKFTTNEKLVEKDIKKQINLINNQIAANQGGARAAQQNLQMWREVLEKRNSGYVNFDVDGNALVNAKKLRELQEQIRDAQVRGDDKATEALKAQYDEIMANVEAYDKEKKKVEEYTKAVESSFDKLQEVLNDTYEKITSLEDKLIEVIQAREDKELEAVKTKYEKIKEENDKYLEDVRKMVDKEREIRDRAQNEEDIKLKERRLAMLQMSGGSQAEILALQKELQQDYQDLSDANVDRYLNEKEEENTALAEAMDKETAFIEGVLESRRETMQYYNDLATQMITEGSDYVINYLMENDQEYLTASETKKKQWMQSTNDLVAQGIGAYQALANDGIETVRTALNNAKDSMESFADAMDIYSNQVEAKNSSMQGSINELSNAYQAMVKGAINSADDLISKLEEVERRAATAAKAAQDAANTGSRIPGGNNSISDTSGNKGGESNQGSPTEKTYYDIQAIKNKKGEIDYTNVTWKVNDTLPPMTINGIQYWPVHRPGNPDTDNPVRYAKKEDINLKKGEVFWGRTLYTIIKRTVTLSNGSTHNNTGLTRAAYAKGGMVDFTGPAWVDGTKTRPEAFLSASDTANIAALRDTLAYIYSQPTITNGTSTSSVSNATYNITVQVDSISNDYDVDRAITRIEDQISKASKYRNINIVKKSN